MEKMTLGFREIHRAIGSFIIVPLLNGHNWSYLGVYSIFAETHRGNLASFLFNGRCILKMVIQGWEEMSSASFTVPVICLLYRPISIYLMPNATLHILSLSTAWKNPRETQSRKFSPTLQLVYPFQVSRHYRVFPPFLLAHFNGFRVGQKSIGIQGPCCYMLLLPECPAPNKSPPWSHDLLFQRFQFRIAIPAGKILHVNLVVARASQVLICADSISDLQTRIYGYIMYVYIHIYIYMYMCITNIMLWKSCILHIQSYNII